MHADVLNSDGMVQ